jgi:iron(III) transport system permease protein|tara:strand:+ start:5289 stop:6947 length:1659 start_codon:yes stop_codon:yes gene_type:complete
MSIILAEGIGVRNVRQRWSFSFITATLIAFIFIFPIASIVWLSFSVETLQWRHLMSTVLPRYLTNSLVLMAGVGFVSLFLGTSLAYLVTNIKFPGAKVIKYALFLPLTMPSFIAAYAWVELLEYAGPLQTSLRATMGWTSARDYWFPDIRSRFGAILVLSFALYPYVYLLARSAFRELPLSGHDVARSLGLGHVRQFWRISLPQARPAIVAGTAIVMMETLNDFGTVDFFAVQTLTTGIFSLWLESYNTGGAAQLALFAVVIVAALLFLERLGRRNARFNKSGRQLARVKPQRVSNLMSSLALLFCLVPIFIGFIIPLFVLVRPTLNDINLWTDIELWSAAGHSLLLGFISATLVVFLSMIMVLGLKDNKTLLGKYIPTVSTLGYAFPGAVLGLGILIPLATLDNWAADKIYFMTAVDPGLLLTGTAAALVIAYCVRFFAIGVGASEAGLAAITPSIPHVAQSLGLGRSSLVWRIYQPLMRGSLASAMVLVFVDTVKELPATLLLRPFNFETLSTHTYGQATLENFNATAPPALLMIGLSFGAIIVLAKANR